MNYNNLLKLKKLLQNEDVVKKLKLEVLKGHESEKLIFHLLSNSEETIRRFNTTNEVSISDLNYFDTDEYSHILWSEFTWSDDTLEQESYLKRYVEGRYDYLHPTKLSAYGKTFYFIKPERAHIRGIKEDEKEIVYEYPYNICLPENLYILQLYLSGDYEEFARVIANMDTEVTNLKDELTFKKR